MEIYTIPDLDPEVQAVVMAKASRSPESFRKAAQSVLELNETHDGKYVRDWHERVVIGYGHNSVRELAVVGVYFEGISQVVTKIIEEEQQGAFSEKSSRYQLFDGPVEDVCFIPGLSYRDTFQTLMSSYTRLTKHIQDCANRGVLTMTSDKEVLDHARSLLPMACRTNFGAVMNARAWGRCIRRLLMAPYPEAQTAAYVLLDVLQKEVPTLMKHVEPSERDYWMEAYIQSMDEEYQSQLYLEADAAPVRVDPSVEMDFFLDSNAALDVVLTEMMESRRPRCVSVGDVPHHEKARIMESILSCREGRHDAPPKELGLVPVGMRMELNIGAWRDMQRHRVWTQTASLLSTKRYEIPRLVIESGNDGVRLYKDAIMEADAMWSAAYKADDPCAVYAVPMGCTRRSRFLSNLSHMVYVAELRSGPGAHESYRSIAQEMGKQLVKMYPWLRESLFIHGMVNEG
jgi:thymidylate synthase ThyX